MKLAQPKRSLAHTPYRVKDQLRYLALVGQFPLRPIRTDAELDAATDVIHRVIDQPKLSRSELDYLDVLEDLVDAYEEETIPMDPVSDGDMIRSFIDSHEVTQARIAAETGIAESTISAILSGKRKLNRGQIGKLAKYFHVSTAAFAD